MLVFTNAFEAARALSRPVAAIGKFDGVHAGHRLLLGRAVARARRVKAPSLAITFHPLPAQFFGASNGTLTTLEERLALIGELGVSAALVLPFTHDLACQAPESFVRTVLVDPLGVREVYVGANFCFGKDRAGDAAALAALGARLGFAVRAVPLLRRAGQPVSTSRIKRLLRAGRQAEAARCLGRPLG